jgi:hypothetical protein
VTSARSTKSLGVRTLRWTGEVDLDLVQPRRVDGQVDQAQVAPHALQPLDGCLAAVGGAVVDDPEHPLGGGIGLAGHDLGDQPAERVEDRPLVAVLRFVPQSAGPSKSAVHPRIAPGGSTAPVTPPHPSTSDHEAPSPVAAPMMQPCVDISDASREQVEVETGNMPRATHPATPPSPVEVEVVDGVLAGVVVGVGWPAFDGVDLQEPAQHRNVQAHAHQHQAAKGIGGALLAAQPAL